MLPCVGCLACHLADTSRSSIAIFPDRRSTIAHHAEHFALLSAIICMTAGYCRPTTEAAHIWRMTGSLSANLRPFRCNYPQSDKGTRANCSLRLTESSVARAVAAKRSIQNSFRANRFCVTASASKTCMVRTAPRRKRHRGREIVLDAKEASVRRDRLHRPDQQDRRWFVAHGTLRCRPNHTDQAGLFTSEELGADRLARRHEQGQGGARPPTGRCHASHACRRSPLQRWSSLTGAAQQFGPVTILGLLEAKCLRWDDGSR